MEGHKDAIQVFCFMHAHKRRTCMTMHAHALHSKLCFTVS